MVLCINALNTDGDDDEKGKGPRHDVILRQKREGQSRRFDMIRRKTKRGSIRPSNNGFWEYFSETPLLYLIDNKPMIQYDTNYET
jgi:hypothetical protein